MDKVMDYIIGGVIGLLVLFSLAPSIFDQYSVLQTENVTVNGTEYQSALELAPGGVEATIAAVVVIFFVLTLKVMYDDSTSSGGSLPGV